MDNSKEEARGFIEHKTDRRAPSRPSLVAEVRAWIAVAAALIANLFAGVWWAATLSEQNKSVKELLMEVRRDMKDYALKSDVERRFEEQGKVLKDHELRIREHDRRLGPERR